MHSQEDGSRTNGDDPGSADTGANPTSRLLADGGAEQEQAEGERGGEQAEGDEAEQDVKEGENAEEESATVLHLDLEGLFLNLLGLHVDLDEVVLDIDAVKGPNNLVGNLLAGVSGLLSMPSIDVGGPSDVFEGVESSITDTVKRAGRAITDELDVTVQDVMTRFIEELVSQLTDRPESADGSES
jgi:hypothetical protein